MRKIFLCLCICFLFVGCGKQSDAFHEISYQEYESKLGQNESFILYIGSTNCNHCQQFKPTLNQVIRDYDLDVQYIDVSKIESKEDAATFWEETAIKGTPTIIFIKKGKIKLFPRVEGKQTESVLVEKLKSAGYIE